MQPFLASRNRRLYIRIRPLIENMEEKGYLKADVASGAGTITILNINKFAVNKILIIGNPGEEKCEFIKTHASTPPSGSTVTLASNTIFAHVAGTPVYIVEYDQIELSHATTIGGSKTLLTTTLANGLVALEGDETDQVYRESEFTTGYYYARFKNSIGATFGDYTDAIPAVGFTQNTAGYIIEKVLSDQELELTDRLSLKWFFEEMSDCLRTIQGKLKRMNHFQTLNSAIGQTTPGLYRVVLPSDIYDTKSNRSLMAVRIGEGENLRYVDPLLFEDYLTGRVQALVATQASIGATSLVLDDTDDLPDSGSIDIWVAGVRYAITYTGITRGSSTLTGIPASGVGAITVITPVSSLVYKSANYGSPYMFTVRGGYVEFETVIGEGYGFKNIFADYWRVANVINSEMDEIDTERYDMVLSYMQWKVRCMAKNDGRLDLADGDYTMYKEKLNDFIRTLPASIKYPMKPKINGISYNGGAGWRGGYRRSRRTS